MRFFFDDLGLTQRLGLNNLHKFVNQIFMKYHTVPYHNFAHGFGIAQRIYVILKQNENSNTIFGQFTDLEKLALILAGIGHDAGHPGLSNWYVIKFNNKLAQLFDDKSPLEELHYQTTINRLNDLNVLGNLNSAQVQ